MYNAKNAHLLLQAGSETAERYTFCSGKSFNHLQVTLQSCDSLT